MQVTSDRGEGYYQLPGEYDVRCYGPRVHDGVHLAVRLTGGGGGEGLGKQISDIKL